MAKRTLADLQRQYAGSAKDAKGAMPRGRGPGRGGPPGGMGGKPKNTKSTVARLLKYLVPYTGYILTAFACILLNTIATLIGGYMLMPIIDKLAGTPVEAASAVSRKAATLIGLVQQELSPVIGSLGDKLSFLVAGMLVMAFAYLIGIVTAYLRSRLMLSVSQGTLSTLRKDLFLKVQTLPVRFFDSRPTGEIMSRFTNDVDNVGMMLDHSLVELFAGVIKLAGTVFFMVTTNWMLTLITVLFVPVFFFGGAAIAKRSRKYYSGQQAALGAVNGYIEETVTGQKVIKVFNHEDTCVEEFGL
ncbi:MAG: ABC transporter ATP-binding protein, partial [Clostridia bacterium]|nr:ABC transporter ATP-binding protein [Clostridia bacterium]